MRIAIWFIAAVCGYLIGGLNPAIILSKLIYHQDIREQGSKNPGFTNFKRVYGNKYAWFVFILDLLKGVVCCVVFGLIFRALGLDRQLGVAFTGLFVMIGHSYPIYYGFKGGKGFLALLAELFVLDWRAGLIAFVLMAVLLLTVKYMSVSTMSALIVGAVMLFVFQANIPAAVIYSTCVLFMVYRHKENIKRLAAGTESKFSLSSKRK